MAKARKKVIRTSTYHLDLDVSEADAIVFGLEDLYADKWTDGKKYPESSLIEAARRVHIAIKDALILKIDSDA